ncbi:hypothetical protein QN277_019948 [Acacia crassicarpa]|uniref:WRKY19-like zinc finger domain-containing protein n=1 Tax=Acacia crassicarpa TaxID=499986 RepID=A0AAE1MMT2_9FABA|nr:hypothetical protein QN277_019948 [Acacia crassicarpa]
MDLNQKALLYSHDAELRIKDDLGDATLSLNGFGFGKTNTTSYSSSKNNAGLKTNTLSLNGFGFGKTNTTSYSSSKNNAGLNFFNSSDDQCRLVLGLGPPPRPYDNEFFNLGARKRKERDCLFPQCMQSDSDSILQLGLFGGTYEASSVLDCSGSSENEENMSCVSGRTSAENNYPMVPVVDEGSTSAKKSGGYMGSLLLAPKADIGKASLLAQEPSDATNYSLGPSSLENRTSNYKRCKFLGCTKGARGASGFCIGHGGGQRCQKPGCNKGAESRTVYCKAHGGGRRCEHLGCTKSAEGKTEYCIAHGGGRRCEHPGGCTKAARGKSGLCIRHGGGKRCKIEGCTRSAEGKAGFCISHGGGRRCQYQGCIKGAQGSTMFCKAHGGGKRCSFAGCTKGAEGSTPLCKAHGGGKRCLFNGGGLCPKSVHGGTNFCVAHGGGKRCAVPGCTKSARGRTDCCVCHGGGKRCKCVWEDGKCEKFARGKSGLCAAHSNLMQGKETNKGSLFDSRLFRGLVPSASIAHSGSCNNSSSGVSGVSERNDSKEEPTKLQYLIPEEVLVPLSMKSSSSPPSLPHFLSTKKPKEGKNKNVLEEDFNFDIPEGRVHGGDLMLHLGGNFKNASSVIRRDPLGSSL